MMAIKLEGCSSKRSNDTCVYDYADHLLQFCINLSASTPQWWGESICRKIFHYLMTIIRLLLPSYKPSRIFHAIKFHQLLTDRVMFYIDHNSMSIALDMNHFSTHHSKGAEWRTLRSIMKSKQEIPWPSWAHNTVIAGGSPSDRLI